MYGAWLLGKSFSFTGHAADIFRDRVALRDKIRRADFIICISEFHRQFFLNEGARPSQLQIMYCGIDVEQFSPAQAPQRLPGQRVRIRSSGRLVEKKGFDILIEACRILRDHGRDFECVIAGSGPLQKPLAAQIQQAQLGDRVKLTGEEIKQEQIPGFMHEGDIYCLPCVWASDNDVDGLPQMLMEAMACGLPAISTRLVGIPDLVIEGKTGLLVEPRNPQQLAEAIAKLADHPEMAAAQAAAGRQWVIERFNLRDCIEPMIARYRQKLGLQPQEAAGSADHRSPLVSPASA
jgi:glycosyltransferase involved in cell wall biosynthesis